MIIRSVAVLAAAATLAAALPSMAQEAADHAGRPTAGQAASSDAFADPSAVVTVDSEHFTVHVAPGTSDHATTDHARVVAAVAQEVRAGLLALGWPSPVPDAGIDGSTRTDLYLLDLPGPGQDVEAPFGYANTDPDECPGCRAAPGYVVLDNDFAGYGVEPDVALRATLAHELGHLAHFATALWLESWAYESTGVWLEQALYPDLDARSVYLEDFAALPGLPLTDFGTTSGGFDRAYGAYVWNLWLAQRYGPAVVRTAWKASTRFHDHALTGYDTALARHGTTFADEFIAFAAATAAWDLGGFPADVQPYPRVAREAGLSSGETRSLDLDHTAYLVMDLPAAPFAKVTVRGPRYVAGGVALVAVVAGQVRTAVDSSLWDGQASVGLDGLAGAERVSVVVVNADATLARRKPADSDEARYLHDDVPYVLGVDVDPGLPLRR